MIDKIQYDVKINGNIDKIQRQPSNVQKSPKIITRIFKNIKQSIYNHCKHKMNDQDISKCINRYFKQPTVDRNNLVRIFTYIDEFSNRSLQSQMVQKIFRLAEATMMKDNLKVIIKRYLHLINQILEKDQKLLHQFRYQNYISSEIVGQFISMLKNIFKYGPLELFPEMKLYRKRWAKRISDHAYMMLQTESMKQLKLDLDKGFSDENIRKLAKSYQKRQFTQSEIEKYLPTMNQTANETRKSSAVSSQSSGEGEGKPKKKVKMMSEDRQERVAQNRNFNKSDMVSSSVSYIPSNSFSYGNGQIIDPRRSNQNMHRPVQNIYPPPPYYMPQRVNNSAIGQNIPYFVPSPSHYPNPNYGYQNYNYPPQYPTFPNNPYQSYIDPRQEPVQNVSSRLKKLLYKMNTVKTSWSFQCKFCGLFISTNKKYDEHMLEHFTQAQQQYEVSHSRTDHTRKGNKSLMPTLQEWIQSNRIKLSDQKFLIPIEGELSRNQICIICKNQLKVLWSDEMDCWVYEDAIRTKIKTKNTNSVSSNRDESKPSICHAECYHIIDQFDKSSDELVK